MRASISGKPRFCHALHPSAFALRTKADTSRRVATLLRITPVGGALPDSPTAHRTRTVGGDLPNGPTASRGHRHLPGHHDQ
jgi:hypothetical protein